MNTDKKIYYEEITIARGLGIILVVLGHAFPFIIEGGISDFLFDYIYSFHMPFFIFLSGFVSLKVLYAKTNMMKMKLIKERFNRLLIPYFVVGLLYLPLKLLMNNLSNNKYDISELWMILIGKNPNYALWTLYTLFIMSTISIIAINKNNIMSSIKLSILIMICSYFIPNKAIGIYMVLKNMTFYLSGMYVAINYKDLKELLSTSKLVIISGISLFILNIIKFKLKLLGIDRYTLINIFTSIAGILVFFGISLKISNINLRYKKIFIYIGKFSMDIYVLSTFIQPIIRVILYQKLNINYNIYIVLSTAIVILVSALVSKLFIRKIKIVGKFVIGM